MERDNRSGSHDQDTDDPRIGDQKPYQSSEAENANDGEHEHRQISRWSRYKQSWKKTAAWNKIMVLLTAVIAVSTTTYACYERKQLGVMAGQLRELEVSGKQTDQLIGLYRQQVEQLKTQINSFQRVEGAYIGISQPQGNISGKDLGIPLENYGRIPSPRVWIYPHIYRFTSKTRQRVYAKDYTFGGDQTEIPPGFGKYGVSVPLEFMPGELAKTENGDEIMWVAVSFKYDDGFGNISSMKGVCFIYNPAHPTVWDACPTFDFAHLPK
jgi:hypothetical protein